MGRSQTPFKEAIRQKFKPTHKGIELGPSWTHHWFRLTLDLPPAWLKEDYERITLEFDPSCEAMIFDTEGLSLQAFTGGFGIDRRVDFILDPKKRKGTYKVSLPPRARDRAPNAELTRAASAVLHRGVVQRSVTSLDRSRSAADVPILLHRHVRKWPPRG